VQTNLFRFFSVSRLQFYHAQSNKETGAAEAEEQLAAIEMALAKLEMRSSRA